MTKGLVRIIVILSNLSLIKSTPNLEFFFGNNNVGL